MVKLNLIALVCLFCWLSPQVEAAEKEHAGMGIDTSVSVNAIESSEERLNELQPYRNSAYFSVGGGTPQGMRSEIGYNFGSVVSLGVSFGIGDSWSHDPGEGTLAILGSLRFPMESSSVTPYVLLCRGGTIAIFGGSDSYTLVHIGADVPLRPWLQLRPEVGCDFTSKHISGGPSLFGGNSPEVKEDVARFGFTLSLEVDFARVF